MNKYQSDDSRCSFSYPLLPPKKEEKCSYIALTELWLDVC